MKLRPNFVNYKTLYVREAKKNRSLVNDFREIWQINKGIKDAIDDAVSDYEAARELKREINRVNRKIKRLERKFDKPIEPEMN